jgi:Zn-dependent peptidase ImmA (M78 family)
LYNDYVAARDLSWKVIIDVGLNKLPISLSSIAKFYGINIISYAHTNNQSKSEDGYSLKMDNNYIIYFNEQKPLVRQRFTVAHELGHCLLGHLKDVDKTFYRNTEADVSDIMEQQANIFARDLLMPAIVLHALNVQSAEDISKFCNVSNQSAKIRWERLQKLNQRNKFNISPLERRVFEQFKEYINTNKLKYGCNGSR